MTASQEVFVPRGFLQDLKATPLTPCSKGPLTQGKGAVR